MFHPDFESLGLNEKEGKLYLTLLETGGGFASTLAKRSNFERVNCYHLLENLIKKGLATSIIKNRTRYYNAEPPQKLVNLLEEKYRYGQHVLPELLSITNTLSLKPKIKYYEGIDGIKDILDDTLKTKGELIGYSNVSAIDKNYFGFISDYAHKKIKLGIKTRMIAPSDKKAFSYTKKFYPKNYPKELLEILFVNPKEFWFENEITIYDNKVAIISLNPNEMLGILIESPVYAKSQTAIFNLAWLGASSFVASN